MSERTCSVDGCDKKHNAKGYCLTHYHRFLRHGDPLVVRSSYDREGRGNAKKVSVGDVFGKWEVIGPMTRIEDGQATFPCKCVCGTERVLRFRNLQQIAKGKGSGTCGCAQREAMEKRRKHPVQMGEPGYERYRYLWTTYRITPEQFREILEEQNYRCAICPTEVDEETGRLDHCHETSVKRGVLCHNCNVGIGHFKDDVALLEAAIRYLRSH